LRISIESWKKITRKNESRGRAIIIPIICTSVTVKAEALLRSWTEFLSFFFEDASRNFVVSLSYHSTAFCFFPSSAAFLEIAISSHILLQKARKIAREANEE
jgi:hypothetical protein